MNKKQQSEYIKFLKGQIKFNEAVYTDRIKFNENKFNEYKIEKNIEINKLKDAVEGIKNKHYYLKYEYENEFKKAQNQENEIVELKNEIVELKKEIKKNKNKNKKKKMILVKRTK